MNEPIEKIENTTNVSKIKQVGGIVLFFTIIFAIILGIFKILAYFWTPVNIQERHEKEAFDMSLLLENTDSISKTIGKFTLEPNTSIELRSLGSTVFVRWSDWVYKNNKILEPNENTSLENSIYGKYSSKNIATEWKNLLKAPISENKCSRYSMKWWNAMPSSGLILNLRDEDNVSFNQNIHYKQWTKKDIYNLELEEKYKRYSSKWSHFYYRYQCTSSGKQDRLWQFIKIVDLMTQ